MSLFKRIVFFIAVVFLLTGCRKPSGANWDVDLVVPVLNSSLNIKNFLGDSIFRADNNGLLHLVMNREVAAIKLDSLFALPDTTIVSDFTVPISTTLAPGTMLTFFPPGDLTFAVGNGVRIKRADVRSCFLTVKFSNDIDKPLDLIYELKGAVKDGKTFNITETIPPGHNSLVRIYNLSGYSLNMTGLQGNYYNTLVQTYTMIVNANATGPANVSSGQGAHMELSYTSIVPNYLEGYFGQQTIVLKSDTTSFGINNNLKASNFMLSEASLNIKLLNEFGAEFKGSLANVQAINMANNKTVVLQTSQLSNININRAVKNGTVPIPSVKPFSFNSANSNLASFISVLPDKLVYQGTINVNPLGNISGYNDFAFYNTGIRIVADLDIPIKFNADYFTLTSKAAVNFSGTKQLDNVRSGNFVILANNGYPFDAVLQAYMLDERENVIDSLFVGGANKLERGLTNNQNLVVLPVKSNINIPVTTQKVEHLKHCKSLRITSKFIVPPGPPEIKILENYQFDVNIVAELNYNISTGK